MKEKVSLILGTALWGWTVSKKECLKLLDKFYSEGFRKIDTATNYPINKDNSSFRLSENLIEEWIKTNKVNDLKIIIKIGSIDNSGSPENNLSYSFLLLNLDYYLGKFGSNLNNMTIHWDNRSNEEEIRQTLEALKIIHEKTINVGLSGINHPDVYYKLSEELNLNYTIQVKHNMFNSAYSHYKLFHGKNTFIAYGINSGGLNLKGEYSENSSVKIREINVDLLQKNMLKFKKLIESEQESKSISLNSFNHLSMTYVFNSPGISGIIIGPSKSQQLVDSINFFHKLNETDSTLIYKKIINIREN
jgi:aryl-alcohol dehydrogenase-like predicted oxidoreductase